MRSALRFSKGVLLRFSASRASQST